MYYNRKLSDSFSKLLEPNGELRWLFHLVQNGPDLDFLIGKNNSNEWISIYRGLSRVLKILKTIYPDVIKLDGAKAYQKISNGLYGQRKLSEDFSSELVRLVKDVSKDSKFVRYYKKEGYFQNELSRKFGICGKPNDDFVIIDKEAVIGYENRQEKDKLYVPIREKYKDLQRYISERNAKQYGSDLDKKAIGNELDFLALDKKGNLLLIEYKHGTNTSGIYLSPLQLGMYYELFKLYENSHRERLEEAVREMFDQKQKIGLINPKWNAPDIKDIVPVLIISEYNDRSKAKQKYQEIMDIVRDKEGGSFLENIKTYNYTTEKGIMDW